MGVDACPVRIGMRGLLGRPLTLQEGEPAHGSSRCQYLHYYPDLGVITPFLRHTSQLRSVLGPSSISRCGDACMASTRWSVVPISPAAPITSRL